MNLRPYQREGKASIFKKWADNDIVMFVLATGLGKTVVFTEVIREFLMDGKRAMLIAHRKELITQAHNTLYRNKIRAGIIMSGYPEEFSLPCQVASIQTIANRKYLPPADLIVIDEGHHVTSENTYAKIFALYPNAKILIVTATPYRLSGEGFRHIIPGKETALIVNSTLKYGTDEGWLVPLKYHIAALPDLTMLKLKGSDYEEAEAQRIMELVPLVDSYLEHSAGKQGVVFAVNVAHSLHTVSRYQYAGVPTEHLDANTPSNERESIISDFRCGLVKMISNVGIVSEGNDIAGIEVVQLGRPTKSWSMYMQMVGRVTRPLKGKDGLPIVDHFHTAEERKHAISESAKPFGLILDNCSAFQDHFMPYFPHNLEAYFEGKSKKNRESGDKMMMLIYVAEDSGGNVKRFSDVKELEGMKLIEVTSEISRKIVNLTSLKKFDELYFSLKKSGNPKPAYVAYKNYMEYCKSNNLLVVPEVWDYMRKRLIDEPWKRYNDSVESQRKYPDMYANPEEMEARARKQRSRDAISRNFFTDEQKSYISTNADQLAKYAIENMSNG